MSTLSISSEGDVHTLSGVVDAPIRDVWEVLSDTDRINQVVFDLPAVDVVERTRAGTFAKISVGGFDLEFDEQPWVWDAPNSYRSVRHFRGGAIEKLESSCQLVDAGGARTEVRYTVALRTKSGPVGFAVAKIFAPRIKNGLAAIAKLLTAAGGPQRAAWTNPDRAQVKQRAAPLAARLPTHDAALRDLLVDHIANAADNDVARIRPYVLAELWNKPRPDVLALCLDAVGAGLLAMRWDTLCSSCKYAVHSTDRLSDVPQKARCTVCEVDMDVAHDSHVEAVFSPAPGVRTAQAATYCLGSPRGTPHWLAQLLVDPGTTHPLTATLGTGIYYVQAPGVPERTLIDVGETGDETVRVTLEGPRGTRVEPALPRATPTVRAGRVSIVLKNEDERVHRIQLIVDDDGELVATAAHVVATPAWQALMQHAA